MITDDSYDIEKIIENGIGEIYRGLFHLRNSKQYQREYETLGVIINMMTKDREHLRNTYEVREGL